MYPQMLPPLVVATVVALLFVTFLVVARPVLRRLALRQVLRRPTESMLVVVGSLLGTTLIVASLVVGDSLDRSVRQVAYDVLGPVDEYVQVTDPALGSQVSIRLSQLTLDPRVDGVLEVHGDRAAITRTVDGRTIAEPRALIWETDLGEAADFGGRGKSGLEVADPGQDGVVINENLAKSLRAREGDTLNLFLYGRAVPVVVRDVVPATGIAGMGAGASENRNAFVPRGTLQGAALGSGQGPSTTVLVSNRGDVEGGVGLTDQVRAAMEKELGPLAAKGATVSTPKREVLDEAQQTGDMLGSLFLFIASFSIIAGIMLLVLIFVMLAEERKGQLGMLRAVGMRRRRVAGSFAIEGAVYGGVATLLGAGLGVLVGRVVVVLAVNIINGFNQSGNKLSIVFDVTPVSILNGLAAGFLVAFVTVVLTSIRIARMNVIAAIRDLEPPARRTRRRWTVAAVVATALFTLLSVPAVATSAGAATLLYPALAAVCAVPLLRRVLQAKTVYTLVATAVLAWGLVANVVRPDLYADGSTATYIVLGSMLSFAAVVLVSLHQEVVLRPLRPLIQRPSQAGLATRIAMAYPTARRGRTGATLAMYSLVVLVIVLLTQINAAVSAGMSGAVSDSTGGWAMRVDMNPSTPVPAAERTLTSGDYAGRILKVAPLVTAVGRADDPLRRRTDLAPVLAIGISRPLRESPPSLEERLPSLPTETAAWDLVLKNPRYVLVDAYYAAQGGPEGRLIEPGMKLHLTTSSGEVRTYTVAGTLTSGTAFYGLDSGEFRYPVLMNTGEVNDAFGTYARPTSLMLSLAPGVDRPALASELQGAWLRNGLVATDIPDQVERGFVANRQLFQLMQGYLALGLVVGICGLGVVMVRAVRERRRTIGVLRALGFRARTVQRSFLTESIFIAVEGVVIGTVLGVLTTYLLYLKSPAFDTLNGGYPIAWKEIALTVGVTLVASVLATFAPARRAARIRPAVAVRVAE